MSQQKRKKGINGKQKGAKFERDIAKLLSEWWGEDFNRVPMSGGLDWQKDNRVTGDIVPPPDSDFPYTVECKKREGWDFEQVIKGTGEVADWWKQCTNDAKKVDKIPLLIFSKNRSPIYFMVHVDDFNKYGIKTNYFITTVELDDRVDCVGIGYFDKLTEFDKEKIKKLYA